MRTKQLLRRSIWFPGIDHRIEDTLKGCTLCQATTKSPRKSAFAMSQLPKGPWESIAIDFYGPILDGRHILVGKDQHSQYPACEFVKLTSANNTIPKLEKTFADYGNPNTVTSDNGPPFNSQSFKNFAKKEGFHHHLIHYKHCKFPIIMVKTHNKPLIAT